MTQHPLSHTLRGVYAIIDTQYISLESIEAAAQSIIDGGATVIQLRSKTLSGRDLLTAASILRNITRRHGVTFIVNDRIDAAMISHADGVHLGQDDIPIEEARVILPPPFIIGVSTHNVREAISAQINRADYIGFGPIFQTASKKDAETPKGLEGLREVRKHVNIPITAIGGIKEDTIMNVLNAGADSVAMISEILLSADIAAQVRSLISWIDPSRRGRARGSADR